MTDKADNNGPFKEFIFEDWLKEGFDGMRGECKWREPKIDTSEFETHMRNAVKEQMLAMRSLVDTFINIVDPDDEPAKKA